MPIGGGETPQIRRCPGAFTWTHAPGVGGQRKGNLKMIKPWQKLSSQPIGNFRIFTLRSDKKISPRTQQEHDFYVIDSVNWVNVIALTSDQQLVMVEQYRHGSETVELEIPGGMMDSTDVSPEGTAQ